METSSLKHTPGPWNVGNGDTRTGYTVVVGSDELLVGGWGLRSLANARLIAAAPEQNEALIGLLELVEELDILAASNDPRAIAARSAIAKAAGSAA